MGRALTNMGTHNFYKPALATRFQPNSLNLEARAGSAGGYAGRAAGAGAQKDIAAATALYKAGSLKPTPKTAVTAAPGPKKV